MLNNKYSTKEDLVVTSISGNRAHHTHRIPEKSVDLYRYELKFGENFHTLSAYIFGDDAFWWYLSDLNKPIKPFKMKIGDRILLPNRIINKRGKKFF